MDCGYCGFSAEAVVLSWFLLGEGHVFVAAKHMFWASASAGFSRSHQDFPRLCYFDPRLVHHPNEELGVCIPVGRHMLSPLASGCKLEGPRIILTGLAGKCWPLKTEPVPYWKHGNYAKLPPWILVGLNHASNFLLFICKLPCGVQIS